MSPFPFSHLFVHKLSEMNNSKRVYIELSKLEEEWDTSSWGAI